MRTRETLLGLVVLALVLAGVFWARLRPAAPPGAAARQAASVPATAGRVADDQALPDVTAADGVVELGDVRVTLSVTPRPPVAFRKHRFRVRVDAVPVEGGPGRAELPAVLEGGRICFEMEMPMGEHRYSLVPSGDGWHEAEVTLPSCPSGKRRWYAAVEGTIGGRPAVARFRLDLTKRGSASAP